MRQEIVAGGGQRVFLFSLALLFIMATEPFLIPHALAQEKKATLLSLEDALRVAAEKNRDIQKAKEYRKLVEGRYIQERAAALPQITLLGNATNSRDESLKAIGPRSPVDYNTRSAQIGLTQTLFTWGQVGAAIRAAKMGLATAEDQLRLFRQAAFRDVTASFYDILLAKELHTITKQNLDQKVRHYEEARKKYSLGVATDYDILVGKIDVENAQPSIIQTDNLIRTAREKLRFLLGTDGQEVDTVGTLATAPSAYPRFDETLEAALKNRPELSDLRHRIGISEELVNIAQAGNKPRLDLKAGYGWKDLEVSSDQQANGPTWSVGLYVTYPIFDGLRTQGQVVQAKSNVTTLKIEEAKLIDAIRLEVRDAVNAVEEAGEIIKALSGTVVQTERLLIMAEKGYEYGVKTKLDVDDAQLSLIRARGNFSRAQRDHLVALVNLQYVMGVLGEPPPKT